MTEENKTEEKESYCFIHIESYCIIDTSRIYSVGIKTLLFNRLHTPSRFQAIVSCALKQIREVSIHCEIKH